MHTLQSLFLLALWISGHASSALDLSLNGQWKQWKSQHGKEYDDQLQEAQRRLIWEKNLRTMEKHNLEASLTIMVQSSKYIHPHNDRRGGQRHAQRSEWGGGARSPRQPDVQHPGRAPPPPLEVDWRDKGLVSPIRNQGACGSCWAFSVAGAMEGLMKQKTGKLTPLSPQNLLDCSRSYGNHGCKGGYLSKTFKYIIGNKGIDSDSSYPYEYREGKCRYSLGNRAGYCSGYQILPAGNEKALQYAVANVGPISVGINALLPSFHYYRGGLYDEPQCGSKNTNHAVLVVGYGTDKGQDFWLVKNSWGTAWGEKGFVRMARNKNNLCGIANFPIYPTM
ncbi:hypothetical protein AAFF_G00221340 [Aldrovandia affinis]|uniref:Cathepsin S n=1 Tax=Aldrovandia affinis TaxID=143900 RepID=A0AAD7RFX0_9TELE|nr:hypothetical protein AAFF_G00221340 [Aldrovandia affinis]